MINKLKKTLIASTALLAASALTVGCSSDSSEGEKGGVPEMSIAASHVDSLPFMAILQVGIDKGWFKDEGVDVSLFSGGGGGNTLRVVTSGDADMAITGSTSVVLAAAQEAANLTMVGSWFQVNDFSWITADKSADVKGATLGFSSAGSATELIVNALQDKMPEAKLKTQAVGGMGDNWAAVKADEITAGWAMHPFIAQMERTDGAKVLIQSRDVIGDHPADLVAVNSDYAKENPKAVKAFFRGAERSFEYLVNDTEAAAKDLGPLLNIDDLELLTQSLKDTPEFEKAYSLKVDATSLKNLSDLMVQAELIDQPVDWSTALDQQFLPDDAKASMK